MLQLFLLLPSALLAVTDYEPQQSNKYSEIKHWQNERTVEYIRYSRKMIDKFCYGLDTFRACYYDWGFYPPHVPPKCRKWCDKFTDFDHVRFIKRMDDIYGNYSQVYKTHGEAIMEECIKYSMGPFENTPVFYFLENVCTKKIAMLNLNYERPTGELVQKIRTEFKLIPETLKVPARRLHKMISEYYSSNSDVDNVELRELFIDKKSPIYLMGLCWCKTGTGHIPWRRNSNFTITEHIRDSSLFHNLLKLNTTHSYLKENEWDISFSTENASVTVPWIFNSQNASIDCELKVTYRYSDFFADDPKLLNSVRLMCPYCKFEHGTACEYYRKLPFWHAPLIYDVTEEETKRVYQEYKEFEKNGTIPENWAEDAQCGYTYSGWKTFDIPNRHYYKLRIECLKDA